MSPAKYPGIGLHLTRKHPSDATHVLKCIAQSASMMRQAHRRRTALLRAQAERQKAHVGFRHRQHRTSRGPCPRADGRRADRALDHARAAANGTAAAHPDRRGRALRAPPPPTRRSDPPPGPRAAQTQLRPAAAELVHAIVTGSTPVLRAVDRNPDRAPDIAA